LVFKKNPNLVSQILLLKLGMHIKFWMFIWILVFSSFYLEVFMLFGCFYPFIYFKNLYGLCMNHIMVWWICLGLCKNHDFCWIMVWIMKLEWNMLCMDL